MKLHGMALAGALAALSSAAGAQAPAPADAARPPAPPMQIKQVKPGLYFITGGGGNVVLRTTPAGAILVDTKLMSDKNYDDLSHLIASVTDKPVKYVFDTHSHTDHTGNNDKFIAAGIPVIGQKNMPEILRQLVPTVSPRVPASPTVLYDKTYDVKLGGAEAKAYSFGPGHTGADTEVYFPDLKAVAMGDLLVAATPNFDEGYTGGSILGFQNSLAQTLKLNFDVAFPGHGDEPMTRAQVEAYKAKFDTLVDRLKAAVKAGVPRDQFIASIKTDDLGWNLTGQFWVPKPRVDALYDELEKAQAAKG